MKQLIGIVQKLKEIVKFYYGKIDNDKFVIMISLFLNKYNFHFIFVPSNWKEWYYDKEGRKFVNNDIRYCLSLGIFQFIFHDFTGIDYIHLVVDEDVTPYNQGQDKEIYIFKYLLRKNAMEHKYIWSAPLTFNYSIKPNNSYIYYLTIKNNWLILNNLGAYCQIRFPECYLPKTRIDYYFPKYKKNKTLEGYIPYIKIEYLEGETT